MDAYEREIYQRILALPLSEARMALARGEYGQPPDSPNYLFALGVISAIEKNEGEHANAKFDINRNGTAAPTDERQNWHKRPLGDLGLKVAGGILAGLGLGAITHWLNLW